MGNSTKYEGILKDFENKKGYHLTDIPKGEYGQLSKVIEEALELKDAMEQGQKIMCLVELSDILGAIEGYLENHYGDMVTVTDLFNMAAATKRAFETGQRK
jgi:phosphoribosyl-ATP pyrophosphohydrolase